MHTDTQHKSTKSHIGKIKLRSVDHFTYLGNVISKDRDIEKKVNTWLAKAATVFRRLDYVWQGLVLLG